MQYGSLKESQIACYPRTAVNDTIVIFSYRVRLPDLTWFFWLARGSRLLCVSDYCDQCFHLPVPEKELHDVPAESQRSRLPVASRPFRARKSLGPIRAPIRRSQKASSSFSDHVYRAWSFLDVWVACHSEAFSKFEAFLRIPVLWSLEHFCHLSTNGMIMMSTAYCCHPPCVYPQLAAVRSPCFPFHKIGTISENPPFFCRKPQDVARWSVKSRYFALRQVDGPQRDGRKFIWRKDETHW